MFINYLKTLRQFDHNVRMYLLTAALLGFGYFGFVAVLMNLYLLRLGYGPQFIGWVNGAPAIAFATSSIPAGVIGSRIGYRRAVIIGISLIGLSNLLLPSTELLPTDWRNIAIIATRLTSGMGFSLYMVNANPYLVAATNPSERNHVFSMQVALLPLAGFVGNLIAGILPEMLTSFLNVTLDHPAPYRYPLLIAGFMLIPAALALLTTQDIAPEKSETKSSDKSADTALYFIVGFLALTATFRMMGEGAARSFFNVYLDAGLGVSTARIGLLIAIGQVIAGPAALAAPFLVSRVGKVPAVIYATLGIAGSLVIMGTVPNWIGAGIGFTGVVGMLSIARAVINVIHMEIVTPDWRGTTSGVTSMAMGIGFSSMTLGGGYIITAVGYQNFFLLGALMVSISATIFWSYFRTPRGEYARHEPQLLQAKG
ncbi:MAG: MFS transporter [Chloroflexota bacterium]